LTDTFDDVLAAAVANSVAIHVVQLDNPPPEDEVGTLKPYIGPVDEFARLACETGGSYQYAWAPEDLRPLFAALTTGVAANYEIEVQIGALASDDLGPGAYRISTAMTVNLLGDTRSFQFAGDQIDATSMDIVDRRLTVFKRPVPER